MKESKISLNIDPQPFYEILIVREVKVSNGAGFIVVLTGTVLTMPGLPKVPAAEKIDINKDGEIIGIF